MIRAAFFDVDRTLVRVNTGHLYIRWRFRRKEATFRDLVRVSSWIARYSLGYINAESVSVKALRMLAGVEEEKFRADCEEWYQSVVRAHVSPRAKREVEARTREGWHCVLLSASTPYTVAPLARELGIPHVLCTLPRVKDGRFTGDILPPLCYGPGKVRIAEAWAEKHGASLQTSAFFTDSASDIPMLERVGEPRVINPDLPLRIRAYRRGWPVERW